MQELTGSVWADLYPLEEFLGSDERGAYFRTTWQHTRSVIQLMPSGNADFWRRAMQLDHPNVQRVLDFGQTSEGFFVVHEFPDDFFSSALQNGVSREEAKEVVRAVREGLAYLHTHGFAHSALHPDHIVAVGDAIKLESGTLRDGSPVAEAEDSQGLERLAASLGVPETKPLGGTKRPWMIVAAAVVTVVAVIGLTRHSSPPAPRTRPVTYVAPSPATPAPAPRVSTPLPPTGNWRVIAYTYTHYRDAAKKAESINKKHPEFHAEVFTPNGGNRMPYLVALGGRTTRVEAERLERRAKAEGLPHDTFARNYVN